MSKFIYTNQNKLVDLEEFRCLYITELPDDGFAPTRKWWYCVDGDWKERGSLTLACFREEDDNDKSAKELAKEYLLYLKSIIGCENAKTKNN